MGQEVVDVSSDLGLGLHDAGVRVDEERSCERVGEAVDGLEGGFDAVDREDIGDVLVLDVVGVAVETDGIGASDDALDEDVVVFGELGVGSIEDWFLIFFEDDFDEVVEGTGVGAWDVAQDVLVGPLGADIGPGFGCGEDGSQLFEGDVGDEVILAGDADSDGIGADTELDGGAGGGESSTRLDLGGLDRAGSVGDVGLTGDAEAFEAGA